MAYLISSDRKTPIAYTSAKFPAGAVEFSFEKGYDALSQYEVLYNSKRAYLLNAKKWEKEEMMLPFATKIESDPRHCLMFLVEEDEL